MRQPHLRMAAQRHAFSPGWQPRAACPAAGCWPDVPAGQNALLLLPMASICRHSAYASQPALLVNTSLACCCPIARCLWLQRASSWHPGELSSRPATSLPVCSSCVTVVFHVEMACCCYRRLQMPGDDPCHTVLFSVLFSATSSKARASMHITPAQVRLCHA